MTKPHQEDLVDPFFITEAVAAEMIAAGYEFAPPSHCKTTSLAEILAGLTDAELATWQVYFRNWRSSVDGLVSLAKSDAGKEKSC